jgi:hypothetical protein
MEAAYMLMNQEPSRSDQQDSNVCANVIATTTLLINTYPWRMLRPITAKQEPSRSDQPESNISAEAMA